MTDTRVIAHAPNGAPLGPVPTPESIQAGFPLNDVGALIMRYPALGPRTDLLGQALELVLEVSHDRGLTWAEPKGGRFLYLRDGRDPVKDDAFQVEAAAYIHRLTKALVPFTGLNSNGDREFTAVTPGAILHTLFTEAQARGAMAGMTWDFNGANDSAGTAWPQTLTRSYQPGTDFLAVLQALADEGWVDYTTSGRTVQVYVAGSAVGMAQDKTTGANQVGLRFGRDLTEAPFRRTWEALADTAFVLGDEAAYLVRTNGTALKPWGRQEAYFTAPGVKDTGTMTVVADANLAQTADKRAEHTFGVDFALATHLPFRDYAPGQWVWKAVEADTTPERVRVRQVTLTRDAEGRTAGNVVLNDRFLEADVRQQRRIAALQGGYGVPGSVTPGGVGNDILAPGAVTGLSGASQNYVQANGENRAQISLDWTDVTTNADGTVASDVSHYEVHRRKVGETAWTLIAEVDQSFWSGSPYFGGEGWEFRVRAVDQVFNRGAFSPVVQVTTATDTAGPVKPSVPVIDARLGIVQVTWDGKASTGGTMDADFAAVEVHVGTVSGFAPARGDSTTLVGTLDRAGFVLVSDLPYNATRYVRLLPVDRTGNVGTVSDQATATVTPLVSGDVPQGTIKALQLDSNAVTADKLDAGAITGKLLTGMVIQTRAEANRGIKLDGGANTLKAWDAAGVERFSLDGNTGDLNITGKLVTDVPGQARLQVDSSRAYSESYAYLWGNQTSISYVARLRGSANSLHIQGPSTSGVTPSWITLGSSGTISMDTTEDITFDISRSGWVNESVIQFLRNASDLRPTILGHMAGVGARLKFAGNSLQSRDTEDLSYADFQAARIYATNGLDITGNIFLTGSSGINFGHGGNVLQRMNFGTSTITANASGFGAISHGLGVVPAAVVVIPASHFGATPTYLYDQAGSSASVARIYMRNGDTNTAIASGQTRTVSWIAVQ